MEQKILRILFKKEKMLLKDVFTILNLSFANAFKLDCYKILPFGKDFLPNIHSYKVCDKETDGRNIRFVQDLNQ